MRLVALGLAESRERARALLLSGRVYLGEQRIDKAGTLLSADAALRLQGGGLPFVSRGGLKLLRALECFALDPTGLTVVDVGASTGGFTDCLLQHGAARVFAVDVGRGQLHAKLRDDARVVVMEGVNARHLQPSDLPAAADWAVIDASFISLTKLLPAVRRLLAPAGVVLAMVKPQFEVGRAQVGRGGVVRDAVLRQAAVDDVAAAAAVLGLSEQGRCESGVPGPKGNREVFLWLQVEGRACIEGQEPSLELGHMVE